MKSESRGRTFMGNGNQLNKKKKLGVSIAFILSFVLIGFYLAGFRREVSEAERKRGVEDLADLAVQGATIAENKIRNVNNILKNTADSLQEEPDFQSDEILRALRQLRFDEEKEAIIIGIADASGRARTTDGRDTDVSQRRFFKETMEGKEYVSSVVQGSIHKGNIVVAIPIHDTDGQTKGVMYGIIEPEYFRLYANTKWDVDESDQYIHIIDRNGAYVARSTNRNSIMEGDNLYEGLAKLSPTVSVEEVRAEVNRKETALTQVHKGNDERYVYFAPMDINDWCVVTVLTGETIDEEIGESQDAITWLIIKTLGTFFILGAFCYVLIAKEKRAIEKLNQELSFQDSLFRIATAESGNFVFTYDMASKILEFMNYDEKKLPIPKLVRDFPHTFTDYMAVEGDTYRPIRRLLEAVEQGQREVEDEVPVTQKDGETRTYRIRLINVPDAHDRAFRIVGTMDDITMEKQKELKLRKGEQIRSAVLADTIGFFEVNLTKDIVLRDGEDANLPYSFTQVMEKFIEFKVRDKDKKRVRDTFDVLNLLHMYEIGVYDTNLEYVRIADNGEEFWVLCEIHLEKDVLTDDVLLLVVVRNINDKKEHEIRLKNQAVLDPLTRSYNRGVGIEKIGEILREKTDMPHAMLLLDLDKFKVVNDTFGHQMGDRVLVDVVRILKQHIRPEDITCRLGGDEFIIFLVGIPAEAVYKNVAKLLEKLSLVYVRDQKEVAISASIGIALVPRHGTEFGELYEKADKALYDVKRNGRNGYKVYMEEEI